MCEFAKFRASLEVVWPIVASLRAKTPDSVAESDWDMLRNIFSDICCMASKTSLVGNSKVMAHLLPNLVPPVDREYTLKFLFGRGNITNGINVEWDMLKEVLKSFFYPVVQSPIFQVKAQKWLSHPDKYKWDTSPLKIIDNSIIGLSKMAREGRDRATNSLAIALT